MKASFWKTIAAAVLAASLLLGGTAFAQARYPSRAGVLTDDANALTQSMAADIASYAADVEDETGVRLNIALVHFLDGESVQGYADALFARWALGENDLLVLGAAAEDTFAVSVGTSLARKLSAGNVKTLLYATGFDTAFQTQQYDAAFGRFLVGLNELIHKQFGESIRLGRRFEAYQSQAAGESAAAQKPSMGESIGNMVQGMVDATSSLWSSTSNTVKESVTDYQAYRDQRDERRGGLSTSGWIVLGVIALIVFGQSEPARRARRRGGCGCGPLGWIFGLLGLGALFGRKR